MGDVNGDGILDIVVAENLQFKVAVRLGNGDGTFGPLATFGTGRYVYAIVLADMNVDGKQDIVAATNQGQPQNSFATILLGNGDGTFQPSQDFPVVAGASSIAVADFDSDGRPDIAVSGNAGAITTLLTAPLTPLPPLLQVTKTHGGFFTQGQDGAPFTIGVANTAGTTTTSGTVSVSDLVPAGMILTSISGSGWSCTNNTCSRNDPLAPGASYPSIAVTMNVQSNAATPLINIASASGGGSVTVRFDDTVNVNPLSCTFSTFPSAITTDSSGIYSGGIIVITSPNCAWTATTNTPWVHLQSPTSGLGNTGFGYSVDPNPGGQPRSGAILINGYVLTVDQSQGNCTYAVGPGSASFRTVGGPGALVVSPSDSTCPWNASSTQPWITVQPPFSGNGNQQINYQVAPNPGAQRTGAVVVGGQSQTITQAATDCTYSLSQNQVNAPAAGTSGIITLTTQSGCPINVSSNQSWATASVFFSNVAYTVAPNDGSARSATLFIGSATVSVTQAGSTVPPPAPILDSPQNQATGVSLTPTLGWEPSNTALSFDLYFGTSNPPPFVTNITIITSYSPGTLSPGTIYYWNVVAKNTGGSTGSAIWSFTTLTSGSPVLHFVPVTPCRIADTRNPDGPFGGPSIPASSSRDFAIPSSPCGIPANAAAYSLNLTVVPLGPLGFLSVWPSGQSQPSVSTLNSSDGRIKANAAIVPAGANGAITVFASNPTNVIVDINGYFIGDPANQWLAFYPLTPCRIADTRSGSGAFGAPSLSATVARSFPIQQSACNVPANAQAYALNMTVVPSGPLGFLSAWPAGNPQPGSSTLNAPTGTVVANAAIVPAGTGGAVDVIATNSTDLIIDINGYFAPAGGVGGLSFYAVTPCRIIDTRGANGTFGGPILAAAAARTVPIQSSACSIPSTASA